METVQNSYIGLTLIILFIIGVLMVVIGRKKKVLLISGIVLASISGGILGYMWSLG